MAASIVIEVEGFGGAVKRVFNLKRLESRLDTLLRLFNDDTKRIDLPKKNTKRSTEVVKKGEKQVRKCTKSQWWSCCFRVRCPTELCESDRDIARSCEDDTEANSTRNHGTEISVNLNIIQEQEDSNWDRPRAFCALRRPPIFTVGFDMPMMELKTLLLKDEVHQLQLTAPAGSGKTTLVQMLCQDEKIKGTFHLFKFFGVEDHKFFFSFSFFKF